jgi:hypothetical protein
VLSSLTSSSPSSSSSSSSSYFFFFYGALKGLGLRLKPSLTFADPFTHFNIPVHCI